MEQQIDVSSSLPVKTLTFKKIKTPVVVSCRTWGWRSGPASPPSLPVPLPAHRAPASDAQPLQLPVFPLPAPFPALLLSQISTWPLPLLLWVSGSHRFGAQDSFVPLTVTEEDFCPQEERDVLLPTPNSGRVQGRAAAGYNRRPCWSWVYTGARCRCARPGGPRASCSTQDKRKTPKRLQGRGPRCGLEDGVTTRGLLLKGTHVHTQAFPRALPQCWPPQEAKAVL